MAGYNRVKGHVAVEKEVVPAASPAATPPSIAASAAIVISPATVVDLTTGETISTALIISPSTVIDLTTDDDDNNDLDWPELD
ncbi:hypothetical protein N7486_003663 [Penicillium sp. IBT 16267x]|nr:hypothetical protein N7486_003663 [Penicillium sp. IBT 16267x]